MFGDQLSRLKAFSLLTLSLFTCSCLAGQQEKASVDADSIENTRQQPENSDDWMEQVHDSIASGVYQSAYWFDSFFNDNPDDQQTPETKARIRLAWAPRSRDFAEFKARFRLKVHLPHLEDRVDLILSDDSNEVLSELPLESSKNNTDFEQERFSAAIRYLEQKNDDSLMDYRLGISGGDIFTRARYQQSYQWFDKHSLKLEPALFYFLDDGLGARFLLEYDYQLSAQSQFRFDYSTRGSEAFSGLRWKHGFYHLRHWSDQSAAIWALQIEGQRNGERGFVTENTTLSYRYRFSAIKDWLFFEVEPFLEWPEADNYKTTPGIALRIEGHFTKSDSS